MSLVDDSPPPPVGDSEPAIVQQHPSSASATQHDDAMILDTQIPLLETQDTATQVQEPAKLGTVQSADTSVPFYDNEKLLTADSGISLSEETSISSSSTPNTENAVENCVEMEESIPDAPVNQVNC